MNRIMFIKTKPPAGQNSKNSLKIWHFIIAGVFLFTMFVLSSCNQSGYHTFTAKNRLCQFSLEYPRAYSHTGGPDLNEKSYFVTFAMPDKEYQMVNPDPSVKDSRTVTVYHTPALIEVAIIKSDKGFTAKTSIESYLTTHSRWTNYNLLENSTRSISGISGNYVHFVESSLLPMPPAPGEEIPLKHIQLMFFDSNGLIWELTAEHEADMAEQAKADFDHVMQTFKILD